MNRFATLALPLALTLSACESMPPAVQDFSFSDLQVFGGGQDTVRIAAMPVGDVTRVAFGSCADESREQPFWDVIRKENPDLFLMVGDAVYADIQDGERLSEPSAEAIQRSYELMGEIEEFRKFQRRVPIMVAWDDHDMGMNDAGAEFPIKQKSKD